MLNLPYPTEDTLHYNRDENSFTARLFEGILFSTFYRDPASFQQFVELVNESSKKNYSFIRNKFGIQFDEPEMINSDLNFADAMLFVECVDMFSISGKGWENKTEFDCIILGRSLQGQNYAIVFEVKAYTDLNPGEILQQRRQLEELKGHLFDKYYHVVLISYDNLIYAGEHVFKKINNSDNQVSIITWEDLRTIVLPSNRFKEVDFKLYKSIEKGGKGKNRRHLLKTL
jgi:hypothetical protein